MAPYSFFSVQIIANLFPVAVYYYVHLLLTDKKTHHPLLLSGSVCLLIYIFGLTVYFGLLNRAEQTHYLSLLNTDDYPLSMTTYNVVFYVWQMVYLLILNLEIKRYQKNAENSLSNLEKTKLGFVKQFMLLLAVLNFGLVVFYIALPMPIVDYGVLPAMVTLIYLFIIYYSIKNNTIFNTKTYSELIIENEPFINPRPESLPKELLIEEETDQKTQFIIFKIETALYTNKCYKNPEFKLSQLADDIKEPSYLTSLILNKHFKKSFFDMVNKLRVKDAEIRLKTFDPKKEKIETIAYEVGFNSRASFYRSFKKITGKNPSDLASLSQ